MKKDMAGEDEPTGSASSPRVETDRHPDASVKRKGEKSTISNAALLQVTQTYGTPWWAPRIYWSGFIAAPERVYRNRRRQWIVCVVFLVAELGTRIETVRCKCGTSVSRRGGLGNEGTNVARRELAYTKWIGVGTHEYMCQDETGMRRTLCDDKVKTKEYSVLRHREPLTGWNDSCLT